MCTCTPNLHVYMIYSLTMCIIRIDELRKALVAMCVGRTKPVVSIINFVCTAPRSMKLMLFTLANLWLMKIIYLCREADRNNL
jgi:hypothetical protein